MDDLNWLADLASDCHNFGEKHGDGLVKFRAKEIIVAIERDFGLKFKLLPPPSASTKVTSNGWEEISENVIRFPLRPRKDANRNEDRRG
jgi:hypothetical protein